MEKTWQEMHWSISSMLTLPPCWNRTIVLSFLIMKMERGEGVPHLDRPHNTPTLKQRSKTIMSTTKQSKQILMNEYYELQLD
jgi:hypothetical protein